MVARRDIEFVDQPTKEAPVEDVSGDKENRRRVAAFDRTARVLQHVQRRRSSRRSVHQPRAPKPQANGEIDPPIGSE
jgi:hypothetical protein